VEAVDDERTLRRARKVIWAFRLIFYPGAAIAAAALLAAGPSNAEPPVLHGTTGQGRAVSLTLHGDDPDRLAITVVMRCVSSGDEYATRVNRVLTPHDDTFEARGVWDQRWSNGRVGTATVRIRGRLDGDTARGTVSLVQQLDDYVCEGETDFAIG
jgi:hypothetical protein